MFQGYASLIKPANKYSQDSGIEEDDISAPRIVVVRIIDVLFEDQLCSLVYLHELNHDTGA